MRLLQTSISLRLPFAAVAAAVVALLTIAALIVALVLAVRSVHLGTYRLLQDQTSIGVRLLAGVADPALSPASLSEQLDQRAILLGGVGFVLDSNDRLIAHPHIASGLVAPGAPAAEHDAIIAALLDPAAHRGDLSAGGVQGHVVKVRGDDYGIVTMPLATPAGRVGFYLVRPSALDLMTPWTDVLAGAVIAVLIAAGLTGWLVRRALRPLRRLATAADRVAAGEVERVAPLQISRFSELGGLQQAFNRMTAAVDILDGPTARRLGRRLAEAPGLLVPHPGRVTVMATGLIGFSVLGETLSEQQRIETLRRHLTLVAGRIAAHQGLVLQVAGDGMLAVWGALEADDRHESGAISAAREIREFFLQDNAARREAGLRALRLAVGIARAEVTIGDLGPAGETRFGLLGPVVPIATGLEKLCRQVSPDAEVTILADAAAVDAAEIMAENIGIHELDTGKTVAVHRL